MPKRLFNYPLSSSSVISKKTSIHYFAPIHLIQLEAGQGDCIFPLYAKAIPQDEVMLVHLLG